MYRVIRMLIILCCLLPVAISAKHTTRKSRSKKSSKQTYTNPISPKQDFSHTQNQPNLLEICIAAVTPYVLYPWQLTAKPTSAEIFASVSIRDENSRLLIAQILPKPSENPTAAEVFEAAAKKARASGKRLPVDTPVDLMIPVEGFPPHDLFDSFRSPRSGKRVHNAIDIKAEHNTPVLATASGKILKLHFSKRGGVSLYQLSTDNKYIYYYAHLDRYANDIEEGMEVKQGHIIGYVGDTGNAGKGNYHLHFGVYRTANPKRFWEGEAINPYLLLTKTNE